MRCAWQAFINILPMWMREDVDKYGRDDIQELRLRLNLPPEIIMPSCSRWLSRLVSEDDLNYCINVASKYSPWTSNTISNGYITALGGHRIGICGTVVAGQSSMRGIQHYSSLCIRVARDFPGSAFMASSLNSSVLVIGKPGSGKTTFLRDLIRMKSNTIAGSIAVVDEKGEIFPYAYNEFCFSPGKKTDIISGCSKIQGIEMMLRNMSPEIIAVDEITAEEDCMAIMKAGWCGVKLYATAHASNKEEFLKRKVYQPLVQTKLFEALVTMLPDKSYVIERLNV